MKKSIVFPIILLLLAGCSDREFTPEDINNGPTESSFMSVNIVASGIGTRAATELANGDYENEGGFYRDGTSDESHVEEVLFLFFNDEGNPTWAFKDPTSGSYQTYYLWKVTEGSDNADKNHDETVEKILKETIHISVPHNHAKPTQLLAVVNPTTTHKTSLTDQPLSKLRDIVEDYEFDENDNSSKLSERGKFVMTNSVYYEATDNNKEIIYTTKIKSTNYHDSATEAEKDPIIVYVERVLARIDLKININNNTNNRKEATDDKGKFYYYYTGTTLLPENADKGAYENPEDIYVRFLGWNVFDTPNKSRLIKNIGDASWNNATFFGKGLPWNSPDFHRSFWAVNPANNMFSYKKGSLMPEADLNADSGNNVDTKFEEWYANNNRVPAPNDQKDYVTAYFQENAAPLEPNVTSTDKVYGQSYVAGAPVQPSKVILAAQLVNENGEPRELAKWGGKFYGSWTGLATQFCNEVLDLYYVEQEASESNPSTVLHRIKPEHLTYVSSNDSYKVTVALSEKGEKVTWYIGDTIDKTTDFDKDRALTTEDANKYIKDATGEHTVTVWKNGYTYFYFTIRHLGYDETSPAFYGVVRNHIYDATVTKVSGLGTPVSDPDATITVTPPDEDTGILAAQVRILSWRLVSQQYELNW